MLFLDWNRWNVTLGIVRPTKNSSRCEIVFLGNSLSVGWAVESCLRLSACAVSDSTVTLTEWVDDGGLVMLQDVRRCDAVAPPTRLPRHAIRSSIPCVVISSGRVHYGRVSSDATLFSPDARNTRHRMRPVSRNRYNPARGVYPKGVGRAISHIFKSGGLDRLVICVTYFW